VTRGLVPLVAGVVLAACDHTPASSWAPPDRGPLTGGNPHQVTYNPGSDLRPSWLADGSGFFYTRERLDRTDGDRCLGLLPPNGGVLLDEICDTTPAGADSLTSFESAAVAADGRFAYVRASTPLSPPSIAPFHHELRLGTLGNPGGSAVRSLPYTAPSGRVHAEIAWLQWLSSAELVYLGQAIEYQRACGSCPVDTIRVGLEVVRLDPTIGVPIAVAGTDSATSVATASGAFIYYTLPNDSVVWIQGVPGGLGTAGHNFGAGVTPRDITVGGGRLAAVTGPGLLRLVQLSTGAETPLTAPGLVFFKRPALAPDGRRLVAEGYRFQIDTIRIPGDGIASIDTIVSRVGDLWVFDLP